MKKQQNLQARKRRTNVRARLSGRVRLLVFRSNKAIYAQLIDDNANKVIASSSNLKGKTGVAGAQEVGKNIADLAKKAKVEMVSFDRNGLRYHGQVKALAESAREAGLQF